MAKSGDGFKSNYGGGSSDSGGGGGGREQKGEEEEKLIRLHPSVALKAGE